MKTINKLIIVFIVFTLNFAAITAWVMYDKDNYFILLIVVFSAISYLVFIRRF